jgi:hypothetical protein
MYISGIILILIVINLPIMSRTVSALKGFQVPFDSAICSSFVEIKPLLSLSTLKNHKYFILKVFFPLIYALRRYILL